MEKVELRTADIAAENAAKLAELFPDIVTEVLDEDGSVRHSIDVEALKAHVGDVAEDKRERYQFTWPGKQKARAEAIRPIDKTMRPCVDESVNWDTTENLYIEGDNLDALKILRETYAGKIKMIYIDPPYNTGHDFIYKDSRRQSQEDMDALSSIRDDEGNLMDQNYVLNSESKGTFHSDWCSMMYSRLQLARDLLTDEGIVFISIDDAEQENLKKMCDEVFGAINFVAQLATVMNLKGNNDQFGFAGSHEYTLVYMRDVTSVRDLGGVALSEEDKKGYEYCDERGRYKMGATLMRTGEAGARAKRPKGYYPIYVSPDYERLNIQRQTDEDIEVYPVTRDGVEMSWRRSPDNLQQTRDEFVIRKTSGGVSFYKKQRLEDDMRKGKKPKTLFYKSDYSSGNGTAAIKALFNGRLFDNPKPIALIKDFVQIGARNDSIVLDFFSGSATTAHAVMQLNAEDGGNRKFITVQLPEVCDEKSEAAKAGYKNICEIGKERIRRAGAKIAAEVEEANAQLRLGEEPKCVPDIGFRVLKIDSSNFEDVARTPDTLFQDALFGLADNVKPGRTPEDILFQLFPKLEIPYTARIEKLDICGKTVYSVDDDTLVACFDREVPEDVVRAMAQREPAWAVLRDASFAGDDALANFEEIFKTVSPETKTRVV